MYINLPLSCIILAYRSFPVLICPIHRPCPVVLCPPSSVLSHPLPRLPVLQVYIGDKVVLTPVNAGQPLHVSDLSLLDHSECREVNADPAGTSWKICLFMECKEDKHDVLKGVSGRETGLSIADTSTSL